MEIAASMEASGTTAGMLVSLPNAATMMPKTIPSSPVRRHSRERNRVLAPHLTSMIPASSAKIHSLDILVFAIYKQPQWVNG